MSSFRQAVAGPSRLLSTAVAPTRALKVLTTDLPPVIERYIRRQLLRYPGSASIPNPFLSHRSSAETQSVEVPRYISLRREKQLRMYYPPELLPPSSLAPTTSKDIHAIPGLPQSLAWEGECSVKEKKGPYSGRKVQFKGHKHEREKVDRAKDTEERLQGMEKRIVDWKRTKLEAKQSAKPSLPF